MKKQEKLLQIISNETKSSILPLSIVTPTIYATLFEKFAKEHGANIQDEPLLSEQLLSAQISHYDLLQKKASSGAKKLSNSAAKAIEAINKKDDTLLHEVLQETHELKQEIEKLREALYKDELTATYNRKWIFDTLVDEKEKRFIESGVLAVVDLNYFKLINDEYGHIIGDRVLIFIANQLKRLKHRVVRYGGDEFLVLFEASYTKEKAKRELEKLREELLHKLIKSQEVEFRVSFAYGLCAFSDGNSIEQIVELADSEMYLDKKAIKKRVLGIE